MVIASGSPSNATRVDPVPAPIPGSVDGHPAETDRLLEMCPFLSSEDFAWRAASPVREHRCSAVVPMAPLKPEVQRQLCLVAAHRECDRYQGASSAAWSSR